MTASGLGHQVASPASLRAQLIPGTQILLLLFFLPFQHRFDSTPLPAIPFPKRTPVPTPVVWCL